MCSDTSTCCWDSACACVAFCHCTPTAALPSSQDVTSPSAERSSSAGFLCCFLPVYANHLLSNYVFWSVVEVCFSLSMYLLNLCLYVGEDNICVYSVSISIPQNKKAKSQLLAWNLCVYVLQGRVLSAPGGPSFLDEVCSRKYWEGPNKLFFCTSGDWNNLQEILLILCWYCFSLLGNLWANFTHSIMHSYCFGD